MYLWLFVIPLLILFACWSWLFLANRWHWIWSEEATYRTPSDQKSSPRPIEKDESSLLEEQYIPKNWGDLFFRSRWLLGLLIVILLLVIYLLLFAPPRLGGNIPIYPNQPGRPFYNLRWLRNFLDEYYYALEVGTTLLGSLISLITLAIAHIRQSRFIGETSLLLISLTLAFWGQWLLNFEVEFIGVIIYIFAISGFASWAWLARKRIYLNLLPQSSEFCLKELFLILGVFSIAIFARLYAISQIPYGAEGDETKWVYEVVQIMVDGQPDSSGEYHRDALPLSFYMQAPFQQLREPGILTARLGVIFYSLLATLAFYWLIRQLAPIPLALLSSFLLSISIMDISASRLANVESHVKLWPILALALLAAAIRTRRWEVYALTGVALTLGMLTYDTVWPVFLVILLLALLDLVSQPESLKSQAIKISALLLPTLLALPVLLPYFASRIPYYRLGEKGWQTETGATLFYNAQAVLSSWFIQVESDFIYNRPGPIINAILLPLFVLGVVIALFSIRNQFSRWMLLWAGLFLLPVPILAASPVGRVYYPALPAVYALIALSMYVIGREVARLLGAQLLPFGSIIGIVFLVWLPILNFYIYFNEVEDSLDRLLRREIGELAQQSTTTQSHLYLPYYSETSDPLYYEEHIIKLGLRKNLPAEKISDSYERILYRNLLPTILSRGADGKTLEILIDKANPLDFVHREQIADTLLHCFPHGKLYKGHYFNRYSLEPAALADPVCMPVQVSLRFSEDENTDNQQSTKLAWSLSSGFAFGARLLCDQGRVDVIRIEGEDFILGEGWRRDIAYVTDWTGEGYLVDSYNSGYASALVHLPVGEPNKQAVYIWVRYYKRSTDSSPVYISLDNHFLTFADDSTANLNQWEWERVGPFFPNHDKAEWRISRPFQMDPYKFLGLFIDAVVFTTDTQFSPFNESAWVLSPVARYDFANAIQEGEIEFKLSPGRYSCALEIESEMPLVDAMGNTPVLSNIIEVVVLE